MMATKSFTVSSLDVSVRNFATPRIIPAIEWVKNSAGNWRGSDRAAAQDVHEVDVIFYDREATLNTLVTTLESSNREAVSMSGFSTEIFAPVVDHSGTINATITRLQRRRQTSFASPSTALFELEATFRAISPSLVGTSASLATLNLQEGFTADKDFTSPKAFMYAQTAAYADARVDTGLFRGIFRQTTAEAKAILKYVLSTARASTVAFPTLGGVTYPFGVVRGALPKNSKIIDFRLARRNFVFWDIELTFAEEAS